MYKATTLHLNKTSSARDIVNYLTDGLSIGDYYSENGYNIGKWKGRLIDDFSIDTTVPVAHDHKGFINLLSGLHPETGELIKSHKARSNGVAGYDFVVNPDKSVSVMSMFDDRIIKAHEKANDLALQEMEQNASRRLRIGPQENRQELPNEFTGNMLACSFLHDLSRANDPQLHAHNFIFNITKDQTGKYYSLDKKEMAKSIRYFSHIYNSALAQELQQLGYDLDPVKQNGRIVSFRIADVPKEICEVYSTRSHEINQTEEIYKKEKNLNRALSVTERDIIARATRSGKSHLNQQEKIDYAKSKVSLENWNRLEQNYEATLSRSGIECSQLEYETTVSLAINHLFERKSTVSLKEIASEAMVQNFGNLDFEDLKTYLQDPVNIQKHKLLNLEAERECPAAEQYVTTDTALSREKYAVEKINERTGTLPPLNPEFQPFMEIDHLENESQGYDYTSQRDLVSGILNSKDQFVNIQGKAGTGKTTMIKELVRGMQENQNKVILMTPTHAAKEELLDQGFDKTMTVSRFLVDPRKGNLKDAVLVIDEAGMLSSRQGSDLVRFADKQNCRIVFSGDSRQHSSVEAGDFVRCLETYSDISSFNLATINRQQDATYKEAVELLSENHTRTGLEVLNQQGWIIERSDYLRSAVDAYEKQDFESPAKCLFVAQTNAEVDALNSQIRAKIKSYGENYLANEAERTIFKRSDITDARKHSAVNYDPGMYIRPHCNFLGLQANNYYQIQDINKEDNYLILSNGKHVNLDNNFADFELGSRETIAIGEGEKIICTGKDKEHTLFNGETLTVIDPSGEQDIYSNRILCANEKNQIRFLPNDFEDFKYSYAVTSHKAQGKTVDKVIVAAQELNSQSAYVAISRGREECQIHTPDTQHLIENSYAQPRPLAMDIEKQREKTKDFFDKADPQLELQKHHIAERQEQIHSIEVNQTQFDNYNKYKDMLTLEQHSKQQEPMPEPSYQEEVIPITPSIDDNKDNDKILSAAIAAAEIAIEQQNQTSQPEQDPQEKVIPSPDEPELQAADSWETPDNTEIPPTLNAPDTEEAILPTEHMHQIEPISEQNAQEERQEILITRANIGEVELDLLRNKQGDLFFKRQEAENALDQLNRDQLHIQATIDAKTANIQAMEYQLQDQSGSWHAKLLNCKAIQEVEEQIANQKENLEEYHQSVQEEWDKIQKELEQERQKIQGYSEFIEAIDKEKEYRESMEQQQQKELEEQIVREKEIEEYNKNVREEYERQQQQEKETKQRETIESPSKENDIAASTPEKSAEKINKEYEEEQILPYDKDEYDEDRGILPY